MEPRIGENETKLLAFENKIEDIYQKISSKADFVKLQQLVDSYMSMRAALT